MSKRRFDPKISTDADATQAMNILPPELSMLEPPPPLGEKSTQPIPLSTVQEMESEVRAIVEGPEATLAMKAGLPSAPPTEAASTQMMPAGTPPPEATCILPAPGSSSAPLPETQAMPIGGTGAAEYQRTRAMPAPTPARRPQEFRPYPERRKLPGWAWMGIGVLLTLGILGVIYLLNPGFLGTASTPPTEPLAPASNPSEAPAHTEVPVTDIPPALRSYFEKAQKGDAAAMRTLGVMYYYGMNVPKNQEEGLKWYRKAANAGSKAAQKELKQMGVTR